MVISMPGARLDMRGVSETVSHPAASARERDEDKSLNKSREARVAIVDYSPACMRELAHALGSEPTRLI